MKAFLGTLSLFLAAEVSASDQCGSGYAVDLNYTIKAVSGRGCVAMTTNPVAGSVITSGQPISLRFGSSNEPVYIVQPCPLGAPLEPLTTANLTFLGTDISWQMCPVTCACGFSSWCPEAETRDGNYAIDMPITTSPCRTTSEQMPNAMWLQSRTSGTKYFASSASGVTNGLDVTFSELPSDDCLVLFVAPAFSVRKKMGPGFVKNDFDGRTMFVTGSGSCPSIPPRLVHAPQCFENPMAYPALGGSSPTVLSAGHRIVQQRVVNDSAACGGAAQCLVVDIDVSSAAASEQVTVSSVEVDGESYTLKQPLSVAITQTAEAVHSIPLRYEGTKQPQFESYSIGALQEHSEQHSVTGVRVPFDRYKAIAAAAALHGLAPLQPPLLNNVSGSQMHSLCLAAAACVASTTANAPIFMTSRAGLSPSWVTIGTTCSGAAKYHPKCPAGSGRVDALPWLADGRRVVTMLASDSEDDLDVYRTYNHTVTSALSVTIGGVAAALTSDAAVQTAGFTAKLQAIYRSAETRYYWLPRSVPDVTDPTYYRRMQAGVDSVVDCGVGEAVAPEVIPFFFARSAPNIDEHCARPRGACLRYNSTYYGLWGRQDMSMQVFPERGRLHGAMDATTKLANGFDSNQRFSVTALGGADRRIVMVPTYNTITITVPMPEVQKLAPCSKVPADGSLCSTTFYNASRTCPAQTAKACTQLDLGECTLTACQCTCVSPPCPCVLPQ